LIAAGQQLNFVKKITDMNITGLSKLITLILATSIAGERLVTLIKTFIPALVAPPGEVPDNSKAQKTRKIILMILAFACCTFTAWLIGEVNPTPVPKDPGTSFKLNFWLLGLLATGGSAFWTNLLGYVSAIKDVNKQHATQFKLKLASEQSLSKERHKGKIAAASKTVRFDFAFSGGPGNMLIQIHGVRDLNFSDDGYQDVDLTEGNYLYAVSGGASNGPGGGATLTISGGITDSPQKFGPGIIVEKTHPLRVTIA
jgi:hypothetical protein